MIRFNYKIDEISIDLLGFEQNINRRIQQLVRSAAFQFLQAAAPRVRIRTGFAHGGLRSLARALNTTLPAGTPGTTPRAKEYYYLGKGRRILKTPEASLPFATDASMIFQAGSGSTVFKFEIDISYYRRRDVEQWRSFEAGFKAFERYIQRNLEDIVPDIDDYIRTVKGNF